MTSFLLRTSGIPTIAKKKIGRKLLDVRIEALLVDDFVTCLELLEVNRVELIRKFVILKVVKLSAELFTGIPEFQSSQTEKFVNLCNVEVRGIGYNSSTVTTS